MRFDFVHGNQLDHENFLARNQQGKNRITVCSPHRGDTFKDRVNGNEWYIVIDVTNHYVKLRREVHTLKNLSNFNSDVTTKTTTFDVSRKEFYKMLTEEYSVVDDNGCDDPMGSYYKYVKNLATYLNSYNII